MQHFVKGRFHESQALAALATRQGIAEPDSLRRTLLVGARAAWLRMKRWQAISSRARVVAQSPRLKRTAALGELMVAIELERTDTPPSLILEEGDERDPRTASFADRKLSYETHFPVSRYRERTCCATVAPLVPDPLIRTSFRNVLGYALASIGHYEEALVVADELISDADQHRLAFAMPYALPLKAQLRAGNASIPRRTNYSTRRNSERSGQVTVRATKHGLGRQNARACCPSSVRSRLSRPLKPDSDIANQLKSEVTSSYALAVVGAGHLDRAEELARSAAEKSIGTETRICSHLGVSARGKSSWEQGAGA